MAIYVNDERVDTPNPLREQAWTEGMRRMARACEHVEPPLNFCEPCLNAFSQDFRHKHPQTA